MRVKVNPTKRYLPVASMVMGGEVNQALIAGTGDESVNECCGQRTVTYLAFDIISAFIC